jgi:hypothetical protein
MKHAREHQLQRAALGPDDEIDPAHPAITARAAPAGGDPVGVQTRAECGRRARRRPAWLRSATRIDCRSVKNGV